jgi:hypothetical protein
MNWINALDSKKTDQEQYDAELDVVYSERGVGMDMLKEWLSRKFWRFDAGDHQFDGISEGLSLLAGIDPERSMITDMQYGPKFLPGASEFYKCEVITAENQEQLKIAIDRQVDELRSLGLTGRVRLRKVLELCYENELYPPWLNAANDDFECAKKLPFDLITNPGFKARITRGASSRGGQARASKNAKTQLLQKQGKEEFERLSAKDFAGLRVKTTNRVNAVEVAHKIYHFLDEQVGERDEILPEITTVQSKVRIWIKNLPK